MAAVNPLGQNGGGDATPNPCLMPSAGGSIPRLHQLRQLRRPHRQLGRPRKLQAVDVGPVRFAVHAGRPRWPIRPTFMPGGI